MSAKSQARSRPYAFRRLLMREIIGAFEIGVMQVSETQEPSSREEAYDAGTWIPFAALLVQVFACFSLAH